MNTTALLINLVWMIGQQNERTLPVMKMLNKRF